MTTKELSQLYYLNREIETEKKRILSLREAATATSAKISGLPHVGSISDKTAIAAEIVDIQQIIEHKQQLAIIEYNRLTRYIAQVEDSLTRQILRLRYIDGLSWTQVALRVGGSNTADSVRKAAERFVQNR